MRRRRLLACETVLLRRWKLHAHVFGIRPPLALDNLDRDETRQTLLLSGATQGGELAADGDCRGGDRVLERARAAEARLHRLHVIVVPTAGRVLRVDILDRGRHARCASRAAVVPGVMLL